MSPIRPPEPEPPEPPPPPAPELFFTLPAMARGGLGAQPRPPAPLRCERGKEGGREGGASPGRHRRRRHRRLSGRREGRPRGREWAATGARVRAGAPLPRARARGQEERAELGEAGGLVPTG